MTKQKKYDKQDDNIKYKKNYKDILNYKKMLQFYTHSIKITNY